MIKYISVFVFLSIGALLSCNQAASKADGGAPNSSADLEFPLNFQKGGDFTSVDQIRARAMTLIDHRIEQNSEPLSMLTYPYWWPEFVYNSGTMSEVDKYRGFWLKFGENHNYEYGKYEKILGSGRYHFNLDNNHLIMLDSDIESEPKVWTANHNGQAIALVGTHEFGVNNGMQIKLIPLDEKPAL